MATLYRRHDAACKVHALPLTAKQRREYRDCTCWIWASGTTETTDGRISLKTQSWKEAEAILKASQAAPVSTVHGRSIKDCSKLFLDAHADKAGTGALRQHERILDKLQTFCEGRGIYFMPELTVDLLESFKTYGLTGLKSTSKSVYISKLKVFLLTAYKRAWLTDDLARKLDNVPARYEEKQPYTEKEIACILEEGEKRYGIAFRSLLELMNETGMRVSDAVRLNSTQCTQSAHLWKYVFQQQKLKDRKPRKTAVFLSERLKSALDVAGIPTDNEQTVYEKMQRIGKRCGIADCRPHRLRDSFAIRLLLRGVSLDDVSRLLGHSDISTTERFYSAWTVDREARLEQVFTDTLSHG